MSRKVDNPVNVTITNNESALEFLKEFKSKTIANNSPSYNNTGFTSYGNLSTRNYDTLTKMAISILDIISENIKKGSEPAKKSFEIIQDYTKNNFEQT